MPLARRMSKLIFESVTNYIALQILDARSVPGSDLSAPSSDGVFRVQRDGDLIRGTSI